jgi:quercetin dioxygenase-like cupin family protein
MMQRIEMCRRPSLAPALAVATAMAVTAALSGDQALAGPDPIAVQPLTERHAFTDDVTARITLMREGLPQEVIDLDSVSNIAIVEITVQPGAMFPWHTHPGSVLVAVTEGELVYVQADDCVERSYPAGTAFVDPGFDSVHMAFNPSGEVETVVVATFLGAPDEGALTLPVDAEEGAALDEACGIDR